MPHQTQPQSTATATAISHLSTNLTTLHLRLTQATLKYLDLGLEYHALPLPLRTGPSNIHFDTERAFTASNEIDHLIAYLFDIQHLSLIAKHHILHTSDIAAAGIALGTMKEILSAVEDQLVGVERCVDALHGEFSAALDEGVEYRLALKREDGEVKWRLLRDWIMMLPQVQRWVRDGVVEGEEQAVWMAVSAGGVGVEWWGGDEKMVDGKRKEKKRKT